MDQKDNLSSIASRPIGKPKRGRGKGRPPKNRSSQDLQSSAHSINSKGEPASAGNDFKPPWETGSKEAENHSNSNTAQPALTESNTSKLTKSSPKDNKQVPQKDEMFKLPKRSPPMKKRERSRSRDKLPDERDGEDQELELVIDGFAIMSYSSKDEIMASLKKCGNVYENSRVNIDCTGRPAVNIKTAGRTPRGRTPRGRAPRGRAPRGRAPRGRTPVSLSTRSPRGRPPGVSVRGASPRGRGRGSRGVRGLRRGPGRPPRNHAALLHGTRTPPPELGYEIDYTYSNTETLEAPIPTPTKPTNTPHTESYTPVMSTANSTHNETPANATHDMTVDITHNKTADISQNSTANISQNPTANISQNPAENISRIPTLDVTQNVRSDISRDKAAITSRNETGGSAGTSIPTTVDLLIENCNSRDGGIEKHGRRRGSSDKPKRGRRGRGRGGATGPRVNRRKSSEPLTPTTPLQHTPQVTPFLSNPITPLLPMGHLPPLLPALPPTITRPAVCNPIEKKIKQSRSYPPPIQIRPAPAVPATTTTTDTTQSILSRPIQPQFSPISPPADSTQSSLDKFPISSTCTDTPYTQSNNINTTTSTAHTTQSSPATSTEAQSSKSAHKEHRQRSSEINSSINKKHTSSPSLQSQRTTDNISRTASRASDRTTSSNAANSTTDPVHPALFGVTSPFPSLSGSIPAFPPNMLTAPAVAMLGMNAAVGSNPALQPPVNPAAFYRPDVLAAFSQQPGFGLNRPEIPGSNPAGPQTDRNNAGVHSFLLAMQNGFNPVSLAASASNPLFGGDGSMEQFQQMFLQRMTNPGVALQTTAAQTTSQPQGSTSLPLYQSINTINPQASTTNCTSTAMSSSPDNGKKLTGRWNKAHVKVAWDIFNMKRANQITDKNTSLIPHINANNSVLRPNPSQLPSAFTAKSSKYSNFPSSIIPLKAELNPSHPSSKPDTPSTLTKPSLLPSKPAELQKISPKPDLSLTGKPSDLPTLAPKPVENLSLPGKSASLSNKPAGTVASQKSADLTPKSEVMKREKSRTPTKPNTSSSSHNSMMRSSAAHKSMMGDNAAHKSMMGSSVPHNSMMSSSAPHNSMMGSAPHNSMMSSGAPHNSMMGSSTPHNSMLSSSTPHNSMLSSSTPHNSMMSSSAPHNSMMSSASHNSMMTKVTTSSSSLMAATAGMSASSATGNLPHTFKTERSESPHYNTAMNLMNGNLKDSRSSTPSSQGTAASSGPPRSSSASSTSRLHAGDTTQQQWKKVNKISGHTNPKTTKPAQTKQSNDANNIRRPHSITSQSSSPSIPAERYASLKRPRTKSPSSNSSHKRKSTAQYAELTTRNANQYTDLTNKNTPQYTELTSKTNPPTYTELTNKSSAPQFTELNNMNGNTPYNNNELLQQIMAQQSRLSYMPPGMNGVAAAPPLQTGLAQNLGMWGMDKFVGGYPWPMNQSIAEKWQEMMTQPRNQRPMDGGMYPGYQLPGLQQSTPNSRLTGSAGASTNGTSSDAGEPHS